MNGEKNTATSKIHTWKAKKDFQKIIEKDGKLFVFHFDKIFGFPEKLKVYERFLIGKESYINQLDTITKYANFFVNNYDEENELATAYLKIKYALDKQKMFDQSSMNAYIDFLYEVLFTKTMIEKIKIMTEENYLDDIEANTDEKKKYLKNEKKHLESLEFTNQHIKILLEISFSIKIMAPVLFHYIQINSIKLEKDSDVIFRFYKRLFDIYGYVDTYELCDQRGNILKSGITKKELDAIVNEYHIEPTFLNDHAYYYFIDENNEIKYYTQTKIDMYTKLYIYVKTRFCV